MPSFIQPEWPAPASIKAFTSLRSGGTRLAPDEDFNLAFHVQDQEQAAVQANRELLSKTLQLPAEPLWLNQVHGTTVVEALPRNRNQEADASFTRQAGQVCAILTADCLPLLICDQQGRHAAAIHAGWRGLAKGIINETVQTLHLNPAELFVWLGPAIGPRHFEVGPEVYTLFCAQNPANSLAFTPTTPKHWLADLYQLARIQLRSLGVQQIFGGDYCTYRDNDKFFSYRREKGKTGRMVSLIWIE